MVGYDLARQPVFGTPFSTALLALGTLLIGTRSRKLADRQEKRNAKRGLPRKPPVD